MGAQNEEVIHDMKNVTKNLLLKLHEANKGRKLEKIIMYRDGGEQGAVLDGALIRAGGDARSL